MPTDPSFIPAATAVANAVAVMRSIVPEAREFETEQFDTVMFVPCIENYERTRCPDCGTVLDDDLVF